MTQYTKDWSEIANIIKENAHWECQNCGHGHDPAHGYILTVHHIDLNSLNNEPSNLVALCQRCHLHFQRPLNLLQSSLFPLAGWLKKYQNALQSKSRHLSLKK